MSPLSPAPPDDTAWNHGFPNPCVLVRFIRVLDSLSLFLGRWTPPISYSLARDIWPVQSVWPSAPHSIYVLGRLDSVFTPILRSALAEFLFYLGSEVFVKSLCCMAPLSDTLSRARNNTTYTCFRYCLLFLARPWQSQFYAVSYLYIQKTSNILSLGALGFGFFFCLLFRWSFFCFLVFFSICLYA